MSPTRVTSRAGERGDQSTCWLDNDELSAWIAYRRLRIRLDAEVARDLETDAGLSMADYDVLSSLNDDAVPHGLAIKELSSALFWSQSRLSRQLARMESRGLVERFKTPADGRSTSARITTAGRRSIASAAPAHVRSVRRHFVDHVTPDQQRALWAISELVCKHLDEIGAPRDLDVD